MILFGIVGYAVLLFVFFLAVVQFILVVINGAKNENLCRLASRINSYLTQILDFLSFTTDNVPFPFSPLPKPSEAMDHWEEATKTVSTMGKPHGQITNCVGPQR